METNERLDRALAAATLAQGHQGQALMLERKAEHVGPAALGTEMGGVSRQRVNFIEQQAKLAPSAVCRYREALARITSRRTKGGGVVVSDYR
jgi:hypothetical protein